jgi:hypothetical protein
MIPSSVIRDFSGAALGPLADEMQLPRQSRPRCDPARLRSVQGSYAGHSRNSRREALSAQS